MYLVGNFERWSFGEHLDISIVEEANRQPLNDKRNGQATLNKWDRQNDSLRNLQESIEKTENAIEYEKGKIIETEAAKATFPHIIIEMLESGQLIQWRKHPNTLFVKGVDKARIVWDAKKKIIFTRHRNEITEQEVWKIFASTFNILYREINKNKI